MAWQERRPEIAVNEKPKKFKYSRKCKLPSCRKPFKTNLSWKLFCEPQHQQKWHKLLARSQADTIVELATLKERIEKATSAFGEEIKKLKERIGKIERPGI